MIGARKYANTLGTGVLMLIGALTLGNKPITTGPSPLIVRNS